jgi:peptidyl-prolyl cis-trans isomerase D
MAQKTGEDKLVALQSGKSNSDAGLAFGKPIDVVRNQPQPGISPEALVKVFQASPTKLPGYTGATNERGGYSIYKLMKVIDAPAPDAGKLTLAGTRVGEQLGREMLTAYLGSLKAGADVKINQAAVEKK